MDPKIYFSNLSDRSKKTDPEPHNADNNLNSSRELKLEAPTDNVLVLVENKKITPDNIIDITTENKQKHSREAVNDFMTKKDYIPTYHDYLKLKENSAYYDKRTFIRYFFDEIIQNHSLVKLIFKHSILDPSLLSVIKLFFRLNLIFALNVLGFSESLIEQRASDQSRVNITLQ
jgi:hypothetical protein